MGVSRTRSWAEWTLACGIGEATGIAIGAGTAALIGRTLGEPVTGLERAVVLAVLVGAGTLQGIALGVSQAAVMPGRFPRLDGGPGRRPRGG